MQVVITVFARYRKRESSTTGNLQRLADGRVQRRVTATGVQMTATGGRAMATVHRGGRGLDEWVEEVREEEEEEKEVEAVVAAKIVESENPGHRGTENLENQEARDAEEEGEEEEEEEWE